MRALFDRIPLITLLASLAVFSLTLFLAITSGTGISQPFNLVLILLLGLSVAFQFLAQNPNNENAALMFWFAAGVWGAASFLNFQLIGVFDLVIALLAALSAFLIERESRAFSFIGPALFIGVGLALVIVSNMLAQ